MGRVQELEAALEKERAYAANMANTVADLEIGRKALEAWNAEISSTLKGAGAILKVWADGGRPCVATTDIWVARIDAILSKGIAA